MNTPTSHELNVLPDGTEKAPIGQMLVAAGRLTVEDVARIELRQLENSAKFGETAIELGLVSRNHIREALAEQYGSPTLHPAVAALSHELLCAIAPSHPTAEAIRSLRTALLLRHRGTRGPLMVSVVGAERKEGRSFLAANLAIAFAQVQAKTLLLDADLRHGRLHKLFNIDNKIGLSRILIGRADLDDVAPVAAHATLTVMPCGSAPNPQELLSTVRFAKVMHLLGLRHEVVIVDTPAWSVAADAQLIASATGLALFASRSYGSYRKSSALMINVLRQTGIAMVGVSLEHR